jgi:hypothetical protein
MIKRGKNGGFFCYISKMIKRKMFGKGIISETITRKFTKDPEGPKMETLQGIFPGHSLKMLTIASTVMIITGILLCFKVSTARGIIGATFSILLGVVLGIGAYLSYRRKRA